MDKKQKENELRKEYIKTACAAYSAVLGDVLSGCVFDCLSALKKTPQYKHEVKRVANEVERQRRRFEANARKNVTNIESFADTCQNVDDRLQERLQEIEKIVVREIEDVLKAKLFATWIFGRCVQKTRDAIVQCMRDNGIPVLRFRNEPATLCAPFHRLCYAVIGDMYCYFCFDLDGMIDAENLLMETMVGDILRDMM